jgi:hypothetical protein
MYENELEEKQREINRLEKESGARIVEINRLRSVLRGIEAELDTAWTPEKILQGALDHWHRYNRGEPSMSEIDEYIDSVCDGIGEKAKLLFTPAPEPDVMCLF